MLLPDEQPSCADGVASWCERVWGIWHNDWLASTADVVLTPLTHILLILVIALILRTLIHRSVNRVTAATVNGLVPRRIAPLGDRLASRMLGPTTVSRRRERAESIGSLLKSISSFVIVVVSMILILAELGLNVAPLLASAGIAGVAIGFGAQNLVRDFLAGVSMILEDQCGVGDVVDLGPASGTVVAVGLRSTSLRGADGTIWHVRNGEILRVGNSSQGDAVVDVEVPLPIGVESRRAGEIALTAATSVAESEEFASLMLAAPTLNGISALSHDSATVLVSATVQPGNQAAFARAVRMAVKAALDDAGLVG